MIKHRVDFDTTATAGPSVRGMYFARLFMEQEHPTEKFTIDQRGISFDTIEAAQVFDAWYEANKGSKHGRLFPCYDDIDDDMVFSKSSMFTVPNGLHVNEPNGYNHDVYDIWSMFHNTLTGKFFVLNIGPTVNPTTFSTSYNTQVILVENDHDIPALMAIFSTFTAENNPFNKDESVFTFDSGTLACGSITLSNNATSSSGLYFNNTPVITGNSKLTNLTIDLDTCKFEKNGVQVEFEEK